MAVERLRKGDVNARGHARPSGPDTCCGKYASLTKTV